MYILIWLICLVYKTVSRIHTRFFGFLDVTEFYIQLGSGDFPAKAFVTPKKMVKQGNWDKTGWRSGGGLLCFCSML